MRFIGSVVFEHLGRPTFKARNKTNTFVMPAQNFLDNTGKDPRYFEVYQDCAGIIWVRRPAGPQYRLETPYTVIVRFNGEFSYKEIT